MKFLIPPQGASYSSHADKPRAPGVINLEAVIEIAGHLYQQGIRKYYQITFLFSGGEDAHTTWFFHNEDADSAPKFYNKLLVAINAKDISNI